MQTLKLSTFFVIASLFFSPWAAAIQSVQVSASYLSMAPRLSGAEAATTFFFRGKREKSFFLGPKIGAYLVQGPSDQQSAFLWGLESVVWFVNAVGLGSSFEVMAPHWRAPASYNAQDSQLIRLRINPYLAFRFARLNQNGAWAVRIGIPYDTVQKWGFQVGLSLQFSGVPRVGWDQEKKELSSL